MIETPRQGEPLGEWQSTARHDRTVGDEENGWFVKTREGTGVGPYNSRFDAELSSAILSAQLDQATSEMECRQIILRFANDPHHGPRITVAENQPSRSASVRAPTGLSKLVETLRKFFRRG